MGADSGGAALASSSQEGTYCAPASVHSAAGAGADAVGDAAVQASHTRHDPSVVEASDVSLAVPSPSADDQYPNAPDPPPSAVSLSLAVVDAWVESARIGHMDPDPTLSA